MPGGDFCPLQRCDWLGSFPTEACLSAFSGAVNESVALLRKEDKDRQEPGR